jgi:hypothetical protein
MRLLEGPLLLVVLKVIVASFVLLMGVTLGTRLLMAAVLLDATKLSLEYNLARAPDDAAIAGAVALINGVLALIVVGLKRSGRWDKPEE